MSLLNLTTKIVAFSDQVASSNPLQKNVDWTRDIQGIFVSNPKSDGFTVDPGSSLLIFNGLRTTTIDGTTTFAVTLSSLDQSVYRFTVTAGTPMGTRTDRALTLNGIAVTFAANINQTADVTVPALAPFDFSAVSAGDTVFVPGPTTGDASTPFSVLNQGFWQVLSVVNSKHLVLARFAGEQFSGTSETQTLTASSQFQAFSSTGVQVGDTVDISAGFSPGTHRTFVVKTVTSQFFEIVSTTPIAQESGIMPGATGLIFYTQGRTFLYIETDQEAAVQVNNDFGQTQRISPIVAADPAQVGVYMKRGAVFALTLVNRSTSPLHALVISAL